MSADQLCVATLLWTPHTRRHRAHHSVMKVGGLPLRAAVSCHWAVMALLNTQYSVGDNTQTQTAYNSVKWWHVRNWKQFVLGGSTMPNATGKKLGETKQKKCWKLSTPHKIKRSISRFFHNETHTVHADVSVFLELMPNSGFQQATSTHIAKGVEFCFIIVYPFLFGCFV